MLPTRHSIMLSSFHQSEFPYFAASYGPLIAIVGGGGASKSGVPNLVEVFQDDIKLAQFDFGSEPTFYVEPYDDLIFTAGQTHLTKLQIILQDNTPNLVLQTQIDIQEAHGLQLWKKLIILAESSRVAVFDADLHEIAQFVVNDELHSIAVDQYAEELRIVTLGRNATFVLKTGVTYTDCKPEKAEIQKHGSTYRQIAYLDDEFYLATRNNATSVSVLDSALEMVQEVQFEHKIAVFRYSRQEQMLFVVSIEGFLGVYRHQQNHKFTRISKKQLGVTNFIHDFQFYSEDYQFLCLAVDGWQRGKIVMQNYTKFYLMMVLALLLFFLGLESRSAPRS